MEENFAQYSKVLVTGATGFIGAHVVDALLSKQIAVKVGSRTLQKAQTFVNERPQYGKLLSYALISDFSSSESDLDEAAEGCDGIIHVASPFSYDISNAEEELVIPAIAGVKAVMVAAHKSGTVRRVVITSSFASVMDVSRGPGPGFTYTGEDWNPLTYDEACKADPVIAYRGSKKFAELAAWDYVREHSGEINFDLVTLCPPMTFGPIVHPVKNVGSLNVSNAILWSIASGINPLPVSRVPVWIDVRDLAQAHILSLLQREAGGKRYVPASPEFFSYQLAADIMREKFPELSDRIALGNPGEEIPASYELDGKTAAAELGFSYHSFESMIVNSISQFLTMANIEKQ
ncbi:hypothetical protein V1511DRAFT_507561 [Dipodascopsis uninucleata]